MMKRSCCNSFNQTKVWRKRRRHTYGDNGDNGEERDPLKAK